MTRRAKLVAQFSPELMAAWVQANVRKLEIPFKEKSRASYFRAQMYELRRAMEQANHPKLRMAMGAVIRNPVYDKEQKIWYVVMEPANSDFLQNLLEAGITMEQLHDGEEAMGLTSTEETPTDIDIRAAQSDLMSLTEQDLEIPPKDKSTQNSIERFLQETRKPS